MATSLLASVACAASGMNGGGSPEPPLRKRATLGSKQVATLTQVYRVTPFPSAAMRTSLAEALGMTPRGVQIWFQNRRQRYRREVERSKKRSNDSDVQAASTLLELFSGRADGAAEGAVASPASNAVHPGQAVASAVQAREVALTRCVPSGPPTPSMPPGELVTVASALVPAAVSASSAPGGAAAAGAAGGGAGAGGAAGGARPGPVLVGPVLGTPHFWGAAGRPATGKRAKAAHATRGIAKSSQRVTAGVTAAGGGSAVVGREIFRSPPVLAWKQATWPPASSRQPQPPILLPVDKTAAPAELAAVICAAHPLPAGHGMPAGLPSSQAIPCGPMQSMRPMPSVHTGSVHPVHSSLQPGLPCHATPCQAIPCGPGLGPSLSALGALSGGLSGPPTAMPSANASPVHVSAAFQAPRPRESAAASPVSSAVTLVSAAASPEA